MSLHRLAAKKGVSRTVPVPTTSKGKGKVVKHGLPSDDTTFAQNCLIEGNDTSFEVRVVRNRSVGLLKGLVHQDGVDPAICRFAKDLLLLRVTTSPEGQSLAQSITAYFPMLPFRLM